MELVWEDRTAKEGDWRLVVPWVRSNSASTGCFLILLYDGSYRLYDDRYEFTGIDAYCVEGALDDLKMIGMSMALEDRP